MKIGNVKIKNSFVLAPMAGINCTAFRLLCKKNHVGLIYTQMNDSDLIFAKSRKEIKNYLNIIDLERPVSVQLIGSNIPHLAEAVKKVEPFADIIDLNFGCILKDYIKRDCGAALLNDAKKIEEITKVVIDATKKPVTAKIRIGWDSQTINAVNISKLLEKTGVSAICIHGRTAEQKYSGKVNWTIMKQVKSAVSIPIIANGDVKDYNEGLDMLKKTSCDFVMIGREAKHAPWVFNKNFIKSNESIKSEILDFISYYEIYEKRFSLNEIKEHVFRMFRDIKSKYNPRKIRNLSSINEVKKFIGQIK